MRICLILRRYPRSPKEPIVSGSVKNPYYLTQFLAEAGHDVTVIAHGEHRESYDDGSVRVHEVPEGYLRGFVKSATNAGVAARRLRELVSETDFDVVHAHYPVGAVGLLTSLGALDEPLVSTAHGTIEPEIRANVGSRSLSGNLHLLNALAKKQVDKYSWRQSERVITPGRYQVDEMVNLYGLPEGKVVPISNGVDTERYRPDGGLRERARSELCDGDENVVLFVGRLVKKKGVQYLLRAAPSILDELPNTRFVIVGGTPAFEEYGDEIRYQVSELRLEDDVEIHTAVPEERMPDYYNAADVCVVPSIDYEPLPTVVFEAMACGKPVVGTNDWGIPEQVGEDETLVPEKDSAAIARTCTSLLRDDERRTELGERNRDRAVAEFDWRRVADRHRNVYEKVLNTV